MNGWSANDVAITGATTGIVTNQAISREYAVTAGGAKYHVVKLKFSGVTVVGAITAKLQTAIGSDWVDSKTVSVTATGSFYIKLLPEVAGDQTFLPLLNKGRLVITTTSASDAFTVDSVEILQEL